MKNKKRLCGSILFGVLFGVFLGAQKMFAVEGFEIIDIKLSGL